MVSSLTSNMTRSMQVAELAHVARPRVLREPGAAVVGEALGRHAVRRGIGREKVLGEQQRVAGPLAQRRDRQYEHGEAVVEIGAERCRSPPTR